ncbi:histidine phosphatase family protein [Pseudoclavibacter soli]|uniref:histidine phosphatase family protein n=1 Tax=Pseudoclavibacter soli TaxID=452623 RepID=UPI00041BA6DB|nr:histidine phosphatase family protein [Pseudoclavibacter soli]
MASRRIHLVRHGEVFNPDGVLYGRLPGYRLSDRGRTMARTAAQAVVASERPVAALYASPLQRAQESAAPFVDAFGLPLHTDERLIEAGNEYEGTTRKPGLHLLRYPSEWRRIHNPFRPSWGEPYREIAERMTAVMRDAWRAEQERGGEGDIVMVSHQSPIWLAHRRVAGEPLFHNPALRRAALSSITSFEYDPAADRLVEVDYQDPAADVPRIDEGAV